MIGGILFTKHPTGWKIDAINKKIAEIGSSGGIDTGFINQIGPQKYAGFIYSSYLGQGIQNNKLTIVAPVNGTIDTILCIGTKYVDYNDSTDNDSSEATIDMIRTENVKYWDLRSSSTGTKSGEIIYGYSNGKYKSK